MPIIAFFLEYFVWIALIHSVLVGAFACAMWKVDTSKLTWPQFIFQMAFNGIACGFGWLALAVLWHRHCGGESCGFATLDLADFALALTAILGLTDLLPNYLKVGLDAALIVVQKKAKDLQGGEGA